MPEQRVVEKIATPNATKLPFVRITTVLIVLGFLLTLSGAIILGIDLEITFLDAIDRVAEIGPPGWIGLGLLVSGLFIANMARMGQVWGALKEAIQIAPARRDDKQRRRVRHGFRELFAYMFLETIVVTFVVYLSAEQHLPWTDLGLDGLNEGAAKPRHILVLVGCLMAAITPVGIALLLQARLGRTKERPLLRDDVISPVSFYLSALLFGGIVGLASWAGRVSSLPSEMSLLINLSIMFSVVAVFVAFIFIPHIARFINSLSARNPDGSVLAAAGFPLQAPAQAVSYLDSILVHIVAPLTGATQHGRGVPHGFVLLSLLPLTALGFVLAPPYGLIPIILGVLMIVALGRRWAWIEEDRETASRLLKTSSPEIQVGFDNDLKDEALLGYATLFIFVPLALYQINGSTNVFEIHEVQNPFVAWLAFFGAELAKAVPFVDWWEIYNVDLNSPVTGVTMDIGGHETTAPLAKHLTFAARAMVDLVIMAALLQAIGIWQRTRTQRHLFDIGHVNHFDPFAEREFFESAFESKSGAPKSKFVEKIQTHVDARQALKLPGEPYSPERLADLLKSENPKVRQTAQWMISKYNILTGDASEQLSMLAQQWSDSSHFDILYQEVRNAKTQADRVRAKMAVRTEKLKFEKLLDELIELDASTNKWFSLDHTRTLLTLLERIKNLPEFVYGHSLAMDFLSERRGQFILFALAAHTLTDAADAAAPKWRARVRSKFDWLPDVVLARSEMRQLIYDAMYRYADMCFAWTEMSRIQETIEYLELMSKTDAAAAARERARELADKLKRRLRDLRDED